MFHIDIIAGARPNFMKVAPIIHAFHRLNNISEKIQLRLIHTGQHYDHSMSNTFFEELNIPQPDINLGCGGGTQAEQTAAIMIAYEKVLLTNRTDLVIVVGDVTSTMACSIVAKKLNIEVAHIEAGIRSHDLTMPEEINRMVTDCLADYFFTTTEQAGRNLKASGVQDNQIFFVGNVMIDTMLTNMHRFTKPDFWTKFSLIDKEYFVLTLHRPANVDGQHQFGELLQSIVKSSRNLPIVFPVHPRTAKIIQSMNLNLPESLILVEPLGYLHFNYLVQNSKAVITDSGGITEETTVMGIPCMTLRDNTERPETISIGTNELLGAKTDNILPAFNKLFSGDWKKGAIPEKWDGKTAERIVKILSDKFVTS